MCFPAPCECGKTTWKGCGLHIEDAKAQVDPEMWCDGTHDEVLDVG